MSRPRGSIIGAKPTWTTTATSGIWTLRQAEEMKAANQWPRGPEAPTSLAGTAGDEEVALTWTAPATTHGTITDYIVEYTPAAGSPTVVATGSTAASYTLTGLTNDTEYTFRVAAVNHTRGDFSSSVAVTPSVAVTDPDFASVSLLLHMDGSGATFTDSSGTPKTITASGGATQSTAESKFGGKSLYLNGSSDGISLADLGLGTGDFTIEMFFKTNSSVQYAQLIGNESPDYPNPGFSLLINNSTASGGQIAFYNTGLIASTPSGDYSDDQWHHIAIVNSGGSVSMYIDGDRKATGALSATMNGVDVWIGRNNTFGPRNVVGYIDEVRVTTVARYSGQTISVPTAAFPDA